MANTETEIAAAPVPEGPAPQGSGLGMLDRLRGVGNHGDIALALGLAAILVVF